MYNKVVHMFTVLSPDFALLSQKLFTPFDDPKKRHCDADCFFAVWELTIFLKIDIYAA
jgi:hypothetical protein